MDRLAPPAIFSPLRREQSRKRAIALQQGAVSARFLSADAGEDILERLAFLRHKPRNALILGDFAGILRDGLAATGCAVTAPQTAFAIETPWPRRDFDLICALFVLDSANDLPGALIHMRAALAPGGLAIAVLAGAGSLPVLRAVMLAADGDRPAPRLHPQVDVRAGGQLLQRAGWHGPVTDSRSLKVRYGSLASLVCDLRAQGLGNVLADPGPPLSRVGWERAKEAFAAHAESDGRVTEVFEILTLSGWRR